MKKLQYLLMLLAVVAFSCSKDEEAEPALEDVALSLAGEEEVIQVPEAVTNADKNPYASTIDGFIQTANNMATYTSIFANIPANAEKSSTPIAPANGKMAATAEEYLTYKWESGDYGVAYQIHAEASKYVFELFYKFSESDGYVRYLVAEEAKDKKSGKMEIFNVWGEGDLILTYTWATNGDIFTFDVEGAEAGGLISLEVNKSTQAGSLSFYNAGELSYLITWNGDGSGTWTYYSGSGEETGNWDA